MTMKHLEVLVEEPSMEACLQAVLPRILGNVSFAIYPSQCKQELLKRLPQRMRGYATWLPSDWRILVVIDRDNEDCRTCCQQLDAIIRDAGLRPRSPEGRKKCQAVAHLAIEELEAWYFGDWEAVRQAYPKVPATIPRRAGFRRPDEIPETWEAFERLLKREGYFRGGLRKVEAARAIGPGLDPSRNSSPSFRRLVRVLQELTE